MEAKAPARRHFQAQLSELDQELTEMGQLCERAIDRATACLLAPSGDLIEEVQSLEAAIDRREHAIEKLCLSLILREQPVARDLSAISAALKMISDLERIGDQARDIAELSADLGGSGPCAQGEMSRLIREMAKNAQAMIKASVDAYVRRDLAGAKAAMRMDDVQDELFAQTRKGLAQLISQGGATGEFCVDLLLIAKYLERIGDHTVNIAEWVEFALTGQHEPRLDLHS